MAVARNAIGPDDRGFCFGSIWPEQVELIGRAAALRNSLSGIEGKIGAGEGIRTLDPDLGKVVLYP
jgi:hypothetical protein